jgi:hypothetical protein
LLVLADELVLLAELPLAPVVTAVLAPDELPADGDDAADSTRGNDPSAIGVPLFDGGVDVADPVVIDSVVVVVMLISQVLPMDCFSSITGAPLLVLLLVLVLLVVLVDIVKDMAPPIGDESNGNGDEVAVLVAVVHGDDDDDVVADIGSAPPFVDPLMLVLPNGGPGPAASDDGDTFTNVNGLTLSLLAALLALASLIGLLLLSIDVSD